MMRFDRELLYTRLGDGPRVSRAGMCVCFPSGVDATESTGECKVPDYWRWLQNLSVFTQSSQTYLLAIYEVRSRKH